MVVVIEVLLLFHSGQRNGQGIWGEARSPLEPDGLADAVAGQPPRLPLHHSVLVLPRGAHRGPELIVARPRARFHVADTNRNRYGGDARPTATTRDGGDTTSVSTSGMCVF